MSKWALDRADVVYVYLHYSLMLFERFEMSDSGHYWRRYSRREITKLDTQELGALLDHYAALGYLVVPVVKPDTEADAAAADLEFVITREACLVSIYNEYNTIAYARSREVPLWHRAGRANRAVTTRELEAKVVHYLRSGKYSVKIYDRRGRCIRALGDIDALKNAEF